MAERFTNGAQTTLQTGVNDSLGSITVTNASGFPGSGQFRVRVGTELMLVTGVSGTVWAVDRHAEGTAAVPHPAGETVTQVLTAGALQELTTLTTGQSANTVFAGPVAGGAASPGFRALVAADLPPSGVVTSVDASGGTTGLSFSGGPVTGSGTLTLAGTLAVGSGGTGATTVAVARTNLGLGTAATQNIGTSGANVPLLNAANTWSVAQTFLWSGGLRIGSASGSNTLRINNTAGLSADAALNIFIASNESYTLSMSGNLSVTGTAAISGTNTGDQTITLTGDVTGSGTGSFAASIGANKVTDAMLRQSAGLSVIGRSASTAGNVADIAATSDGTVLRRSGAAIGFGAVDLSSASAVTGYLPLAAGGCPWGMPFAGGRLSTENGVAVSSSDRSAQSTLYYVPYTSNVISLFDSSASTYRNFQIGTGGTYPSVALSGLTAGKNYDVFAYVAPGGGMVFNIAGAWTNDTTRSVAIEYNAFYGGWIMFGSFARYLGTFRATGSNTTEDSAARRFLYNAFNKVPRTLYKQDTATTTTYNTSAWTGYGAGAAKPEWVFGLPGDHLEARFVAIATGTTGATCAVGVTLDSTVTAPSAQANNQWSYIGGGGIAYFYAQATSHYSGCPGVGYHYLYGMMFGGGNNVFYGGTNTGAGYVVGTIWN